jgi:hypothetical protein
MKSSPSYTLDLSVYQSFNIFSATQYNEYFKIRNIFAKSKELFSSIYILKIPGTLINHCHVAEYGPHCLTIHDSTNITKTYSLIA